MGSSQSKRSRQTIISNDDTSRLELAISKQQRKSLLKQVKRHKQILQQQQQNHKHNQQVQDPNGTFFSYLPKGKLANHGAGFIDQNPYSFSLNDENDYLAYVSGCHTDCASCATTNFACNCVVDRSGDVLPYEYTRHANANIDRHRILNGSGNVYYNQQHIIGGDVVARRRRQRRSAQGNKLASSMISLNTTNSIAAANKTAMTNARRARLATTSELGVEAGEDALGVASPEGAAALGYMADIPNTQLQLLSTNAPPSQALLAASRGFKRRDVGAGVGTTVVGINKLHYNNNHSLHGESSQSSVSQYSSQFSSSIAANAISSNTQHYHNGLNHLQNFHLETAAAAAEANQVGQHKQNPVLSSSNRSQQSSRQMILHPRHQRGLAYSEDERRKLGLKGLLPAAHQSQELQVQAVMNFIEHCSDDLSKYVYLRHLKDFNELLFYAALNNNVEKLMPLVYTPTVGLACQKFSEIYLRPRGLFITINDLGKIGSILANWPEKDVRVIVVTDGERILGLGDLGANGMGISIGKLSLYTALAGIPPQHVLPITIDVGTNNQNFLDDPFYIGLRHKRVRGKQYDDLLEEFMESVVERWGRSCLIQFEDFANSTAFTLLERYREKYCTFNDDIQGTASVCLAGLISAAKQIYRRLADCSFLFYGAGEANLGTANLLVMAMIEEGSSKQEAISKIWLVDSKGLVVESRKDLSSHKRVYAQPGAPQLADLESIISHTKPVAIIGASAQGGAFNESICKKMAQLNERPIIFALSNPTSKAECTAEQAYKWTDGKCVYASGSPFDPVQYKGKTYITGQGNNVYIFPALGLAAIAAHVHTIPEETFLVSAKALSDLLTESDSSVGLVYPRLNRIREVTLRVAERVLEYFYAERLATYRPEPLDKRSFLESIQFDYRYESHDLRKSSISQLLNNDAANNTTS